jgi:hypothetical protein
VGVSFQREFEIHIRSRFEPREGGAIPGLFRQVGAKAAFGNLNRCEADATHRNAVSDVQFLREIRRRDHNAMGASKNGD